MIYCHLQGVPINESYDITGLPRQWNDIHIFAYAGQEIPLGPWGHCTLSSLLEKWN